MKIDSKMKPPEFKRSKSCCKQRDCLVRQELFMKTVAAGIEPFNASPCPNITGLCSLLFKLYLVAFVVYQILNMTYLPSSENTNLWTSSSQMEL